MFADGGMASPNLGVNLDMPTGTNTAQSGPQSSFGQFLKNMKSGVKPPTIAGSSGSGSGSGNNQSALYQGASKLSQSLIPGGLTNQIVQGIKSGTDALGITNYNPASQSQSGESYTGEDTDQPSSDSDTQMAARGGNVHGRLKRGGRVPGKPKVGGAKDDYSNDTVKALLTPGEIVLPRSVTKGKDPVRDSAKFVADVLSKRKNKK